MGENWMRRWVPAVTLCLVMSAPLALAGPQHGEGDGHGHEGMSAEQQMSQLVIMCEESADARAQRQAEVPLYQRLGGHDRLQELAGRLVDNHLKNETIKSYFEGVDRDALVEHVVDFMGSGTGGAETYTGRDMPTIHAGMNITVAEFLSTGGDVVAAMQSMEYGQEEIDEVVCILVSLKDQVIQQ